jgi:TctA family transporter
MSDSDKRMRFAPQPGYGAGIICLVWAAIGWCGVLFGPALMVSFTGPVFDLWPGILSMAVSAALTVGGAKLVLRGVMMRNSRAKQIRQAIAIPVLFLLTAGFVGFAGPGFIFAFVWLAALNMQRRIGSKRIRLALPLAAGFTANIQIVFVHPLRVPLSCRAQSGLYLAWLDLILCRGARFDFGFAILQNEIDIIAVTIRIFGIPKVLITLTASRNGALPSVRKISSLVPLRNEIARVWPS